MMERNPSASWPHDGAFLRGTYRMMALIRRFEEQIRSMSQGGIVPGLVHLCAGQEATNAGTCLHLRRDDFIASDHRGHGHCLAKGAQSDLLMAEILDKAPGIFPRPERLHACFRSP